MYIPMNGDLTELMKPDGVLFVIFYSNKYSFLENINRKNSFSR